MLKRKTVKLFAENATESQVQVVGTAKLGTAGVVFSKDPNILQDQLWKDGLYKTLFGENLAPFVGEQNAIHYVLSYFIKLISQSGILEWDTNEDYFVGSFVVSPVNRMLYKSLRGTSENPNSGREPSVSPVYWELQDLSVKANRDLSNVTETSVRTKSRSRRKIIGGSHLSPGIMTDVAHGLALNISNYTGVDADVRLYFVCTVAEQGFSVGDIVYDVFGAGANSSYRPINLTLTADRVKVLIPSKSPMLYTSLSDTSISLTPNYWNFFISITY